MLSFKPGWVFSHKQKDKTPQCHGAHSLVQLLKSCLVMSDSMQTPWGLAYQAPLFMGFSRQEYWRGLPFLPPGDLPDPGIEPMSLMFPALTSGFFNTSAIWEVPYLITESESVSCSVLSTLCDPVDCSPPDSSVHGILQARILKWVAVSLSRGSFRPRD